MALRGTREARKAGSWYEGDPETLSSQLDEWLGLVPDTLDGSGLPITRARVIIAPHAGYDYSGPCAAWAYKALDLRAAKRVFVLGPSHTYGFSGCALTTFSRYATPFGDLVVDTDTVASLRDTRRFSDIRPSNDVSEHSLELHLPYLWKRLEQTFGHETRFPPIVPILVGSNNGREEKKFGKLLLPYLHNPENAFIISSDFCHWGRNFGYYEYFSRAEKDRRAAKTTREGKDDEGDDVTDADGAVLVSADITPRSNGDEMFNESIEKLDQLAKDAIATGIHDNFVKNLAQTGNTVCGRHPIGVMMAALEELRTQTGDAKEDGRFNFVCYRRSCKQVRSTSESSVSYVSAYAVV